MTLRNVCPGMCTKASEIDTVIDIGEGWLVNIRIYTQINQARSGSENPGG